MKRNTYAYQKARAAVLAANPWCVYCGDPADTADHVPPLASMPDGYWQGELVAACRSCNCRKGAEYGNERRRRPKASRNW